MALRTSTGFRDLDTILGRIEPQSIFTVAGRLRDDRTSFLLTMAYHVAVCQGQPVIFLSLEQTKHELRRHVERMDAFYRTLPRRGDRFVPLYRHGYHADIFINDSIRTVEWIERAIRNEMAALGEPPGLIVIDNYLAIGTTLTLPIDQEARLICQRLRQIANTLKVSIVTSLLLPLAPSYRPLTLNDMGHAELLDAVSDVVAFLHQPDLFDGKQLPDLAAPRVVEVHIAKHRHGPVGVVPLLYDPAARFYWDLHVAGPTHADGPQS
jgi:replicative DNA helicase